MTKTLSVAFILLGALLVVVEMFEAADGFGVMSNVYGRIDFAANVVGVGLALAVDTPTRTRRS